MRSRLAFAGTVLLLGVVVGLSRARQQTGDQVKPVEVAILAESNWDQFVPGGKEVDAIYGDIVLRNGHLTAVIAQPLATRHANMTVRNIAGALIDLTVRNMPGDQLAAYYPGKTDFAYRTVSANDAAGREIPLSAPISTLSPVGVSVRADSTDERPEAIVRYLLNPSDRFVSVTTTFTNRGQQSQTVSLEDNFRIDGGKEDQTRTPNGTVDHFWLEDRFWGQAYGLDADGYKLQLTSDQRVTAVKYAGADGMSTVTLAPGQSFQFTRRIYPGANLADVHAIALSLSPENASTIQLAVKNQQGHAISRAQVEFKRDGATYATARTDGNGMLTVVLPKDILTGDVFAFGRQIGTSLPVVTSNSQPTVLNVDLDPGLVQATITDDQNQPIACKVEFTPLDDGAKLDFGPETGEFALRNLVYTASGKFQQPIPPGKYHVTISHGPEYDALTSDLTIPPGATAPLVAKLIRTVQTPGWVSGDFHSHSSPSGDNTSSQLGRVLNLVAEHIEFAPCTEHNRVTTYEPHLEKLGIASRMATVSGIELTGIPLPLNHQNAFPMRMTPRVQDGGGPVAGPDLETQIERLGLHDNRSEKLIQVNHPDIGWMFYDKDGDGQPDSGFERAFPFMDVIEVHPIDRVLNLTPSWEVDGKRFHNTIFNWLQLLNQGFRIYGVVNTDAHYNFHGSGWIRNWIQSSTDDPAKIDPMELARATKQGRLIMSNGPYLEVTAVESGKSDRFVAGQDMKAMSGKVTLKVRVQCPNWLDVNRVFVLINGRTHSTHDYSREKTPDAFRSGVVKFDRTLEIELKEDAHIIVATGNSGGKLGTIYGTMSAKTQPAAMTNPIFVDINGDGFQPNKDTLGHPLPVKNAPGR
ncbi:CehA/McbA family metallohydrolase [Schlesneria paludicola]|uniref:CehA/McbA family metallohydrolase n=1 Tax=Schlesneria paludicola TaxID=360056 RepID=UPI00029AC32A|nr:CehA/McbA family metallohydrolase [Schlesneria paludicola]